MAENAEKPAKKQTKKPEKKKRSLLCYKDDKLNIISALIAAVLAFALIGGYLLLKEQTTVSRDVVTAGFIYDGDESTPYSANFIRAVNQLEAEYGDKVRVIERFNVPHESVGEVIDDLAAEGCNIIFTNSYGYGEETKNKAKSYPEIEFCAATCDNANSEPVVTNYHTFMGSIYQGRYLSGIAAGSKLSEMIQNGTISENEAVMGFVAAYPCAEVISGYTAFLLGARSVCPSAVMKVKYINTWTSYGLEKQAAEQLIAEGCVILSHHSNTIGSAIACENADMPYPVYHVGYNQDMISIAPTAALVSCRIEWAPYFISAVEAALANEPIESHIDGNITGNDASGGYREGWVKTLELNGAAASVYTKAMLEKAEEDMVKGRTHVFSGSYTGVNYANAGDTIDLSTEYIENQASSAPTFCYVLNDVISIIE